MNRSMLVFLAFLAGFMVAVSLREFRSNQSVFAQPPSSWNGRLFYLSKNRVQGNAARTACAVGYHMASLWEIYDVSALKYDTTNGQTTDDSGSGPPTNVNFGWIRTGMASFAGSLDDAGQANCNVWTSNSQTVYGTAIGLSEGWRLTLTIRTAISPWIPELTRAPGTGAAPTGSPSCATQQPVWCVQN